MDARSATEKLRPPCESTTVSDQSKRPKSGACVAQLVLGHCSATTTDRLTDVDEAFVKLPAVLGRHWITVIRHRSSLPSADGICNDSYFAVIPDVSQGKRHFPFASKQAHDLCSSQFQPCPSPPPPPRALALLSITDRNEFPYVYIGTQFSAHSPLGSNAKSSQHAQSIL